MSADVAALLDEAQQVYGDDPAARAALEGYARRLEEPLRVAVAGMVKAGKSTLLNAIIGEQIAPTDTGECTKVVTWYRHGDTPRVTMYPIAGEPRLLPVRRPEGRLQFDMGATTAEEVDRIVVDWPAKSLRDITLIDTPGIASLSEDVSARSTTFLTPEDAPSEADAVVYLMRHLHASDLNFLEAFRDTAAGQSGTINALAVLSRADEVGAGRIDALLSAQKVAERYRSDPDLRALAMGVIPVAGLLAQSARTLRQSEFAALAQLSRLERADRELMLLSADRFLRSQPGVEITAEDRAALLDRFGLFGIRLASALLRGGISDPTVLAHELARRSGLDQLLRLISRQFQERATHLKARTALSAVEALLRERPRTGAERLSASLERIQASAHEFRELRLLATLHTEGLALAADLAADVERLVGGYGIAPAQRLGLADEASVEELRNGAMAQLRRWRTLAENPLTDRTAAEVCSIAVRSCEALLGGLTEGSGAPGPAGAVPEPGAGPGEQAEHERRTG